jgi:hypothetical protein
MWLDLSANGLGAQGAGVIAELAVGKWLKLAHLLLRHNAIGDAGTNL